MPVDTTTERHFRLSELSDIWKLSYETTRKLCMNEPGVMKIRMGRKKAHTLYSVPESVAQRIHNRLQAG